MADWARDLYRVLHKDASTGQWIDAQGNPCKKPLTADKMPTYEWTETYESSCLSLEKSPPQLEHLSMLRGNLEVCTCDKYLTNVGPHVRAKICAWEAGLQCVIAAWRQDDEGFDLCFLGNRPFRFASPQAFWELAHIGQQHLDEYFRALKSYV